MNSDVINAYQSSLIYACLDDFTASTAMHGLFGGQDGPRREEWRGITLDFLYRNLVAGLISVTPNQPHYREISPMNLCERLALVDPFGSPIETESNLWIAMFFEGTDKLEGLMRRHQMLDWIHFKAPTNSELLHDLFDIYQRCGVDVGKERILNF